MGGSAAVVPLSRRLDGGPRTSPGGRRRAGTGAFSGQNNLLRRLNALKRADFSHHADRIRCPVQIICASDDLLVPTACSSELHAALPDSQKMVMPYGGHACNVTDPETFNALLLNGLASLLHHREAAL